ncbi:hypothetical protein DFR55_101372 [Herbinix hemicellulosilytica]|uniref:Uncharacterized protein n=1 Tax=Herbinix hemicellulosilytica TaxID=1564487 RepID=A0A0H5SIJ1_HERHM|nr:hypothetical protein [Herbinix hemicellulosilytica]RBP60911.1 hypothetical protein DFR55_101372 [Herbinix hemicellulosilytica]CRZ34606.1 hypothetical protein HHT355_1405 [Herbinix hemicellulosilytica]
MERLTDRFDNGDVGVVRIFDKDDLIYVPDYIDDAIVSASIQEAIDKLAEYEDTGLTPEEIIEHEEMFKSYRHVCGGMSPEEVASLKEQRDFWRNEARKWASMLGEIKMAEAQGLITRYQCKIGDMVYEVNKNTNTISGYIITGINTYEYGHKNVFYKWELIEGISTGKEGFYAKELGKTVFLTKEEAEAMKGSGNYVGDNN